MSSFETLLVSTDADGVATVTLNRPDKHHAMNARMIAELTESAATLGADSGVRVVVLASSGPSFCAGADLEWMRRQQAADRAGKVAEAGRLSAMLAALNTLPKPLIARVQGNVYGGGVCNQASRWSNVARRLGLAVESSYHGYVYDSAVPQEDNLAIWSSGSRGGQDLVIRNTTGKTAHITAVIEGDNYIVKGWLE